MPSDRIKGVGIWVIAVVVLAIVLLLVFALGWIFGTGLGVMEDFIASTFGLPIILVTIGMFFLIRWLFAE